MTSHALQAITHARPTCERCQRPPTYCYCALLPRLSTKTRVVFLRHPRERGLAIGTALIAHLSLPDSTLVDGIELDHHPEVSALLSAPDVALLFPGENARPATNWTAPPPSTLVVVDGTWWQAKSLLKKNPRLASLPRMSLTPAQQSNYRIRREPSEQYLSTIEAVAMTLGILEGDADRFAQMLQPFEFMVDRQLEAQRRRQHRVRKRRKPPPEVFRELRPVLKEPMRAVIAHAEVNSHPRHDRAPGPPELLQLVAVRPATGERFAAFLKPRRRLGHLVPERLGVDRELLLDGESVASFAARWRAFLGDDPALCLWRPFAADLFERELGQRPRFIDLRTLATVTLQRSPGGIELGAERLAGMQAPRHEHRADRMLALLHGIFDALVGRATNGDADVSTTSDASTA